LVDLQSAVGEGGADIPDDPLHLLDAAFPGYVVEEVGRQIALGRADVALIKGFGVEAANQGLVLFERHGLNLLGA
jgi:hypothetical protein